MVAIDSGQNPIFASREQVTAALVRAANNARLLAEQTGTKLIVVLPSCATETKLQPWAGDKNQ